MTADRKKMGDLHEFFLAKLFGGRQSRGSGNQWRDQGDGRNNHLTTEPAYCWDGKSTRGESITVTRAMIAKICGQSGAERPAIGLRWYGNDRLDLVDADWVALPAEDVREMLEMAREPGGDPDLSLLLEDIGKLAAALGKVIIRPELPAHEILEDITAEAGRLRADRDALAASDPPVRRDFHELMECTDGELREALARIGPGKRARLLALLAGEARPEPDTTVVFSLHTPDQRGIVSQGTHITRTGARSTFPVETIRVERTMDDKPFLVVNEARVRRGEWWLDGVLQARVGLPGSA